MRSLCFAGFCLAAIGTDADQKLRMPGQKKAVVFGYSDLAFLYFGVYELRELPASVA